MLNSWLLTPLTAQPSEKWVWLLSRDKCKFLTTKMCRCQVCRAPKSNWFTTTNSLEKLTLYRWARIIWLQNKPSFPHKYLQTWWFCPSTVQLQWVLDSPRTVKASFQDDKFSNNKEIKSRSCWTNLIQMGGSHCRLVQMLILFRIRLREAPTMRFLDL